MNALFFSFCALATIAVPLNAASIAEKRAQLTQSSSSGKTTSTEAERLLNRELTQKISELHQLYDKIQKEFATTQPEELSKERLDEIAKLRGEIRELENRWKETSKNSNEQEEEGLWHQPDTTIGQLVVDYGACDYLYLIPPEIASLKVHISSQLSVPRALWAEMLQLVLNNYGIGIKQLNPFMRQLFFLRLSQASVVAITEDRHEVQFMDPEARICLVLTPPVTELRRTLQFIEKFAPQEQMNLQVVGNSIIMVGIVREVKEMIKIYDFISQPKLKQEYRLVALQKGQSDEVAKILQSLFEGDGFKFSDIPQSGGRDKRPPFTPTSSTDTSGGFRVIPLKQPSQSLFLMGSHDQIEKAAQIIQEIETKIGEMQDKVVYWYACKHSEAGEIAEVLSQVYAKMISSPEAFGGKGKRSKGASEITETRDEYSNLVVKSPKVGISDSDKKRTFERNENFIVDTKTNSVVMVVESSVLPKLKELTKKLDVPKQMVQIDVLLFERKVKDNNSFGLNMLKMGDAASDSHERSLTWNTKSKKKKKKKDSEGEASGNRGILQFLMSRTKHGSIPAFDLAYSFLLSQEDVQINANPTVTTINQTPAKIHIVDQISINTGVVEIDTTNTTRLKDSYSREEYGITIQVTPTIHAKMDDEDDPHAQKFIHLETDLVFDTTHPKADDRPDVTRRNIKNEVRVADGETVILGGLRKKVATDDAEMVPFLGELPGIGKLFANTRMEDVSVEMFIFITPRIVPDKSEEFRLMRRKALMVRPGDLPEFLAELDQAQKDDKRSLFQNSLKLLFGRSN